MSLSIPHLRFSIFVLETLKFKKKGRFSHWQCSQYLELNHECDISLLLFVATFVWHMTSKQRLINLKKNENVVGRKWKFKVLDLPLKYLHVNSILLKMPEFFKQHVDRIRVFPKKYGENQVELILHKSGSFKRSFHLSFWYFFWFVYFFSVSSFLHQSVKCLQCQPLLRKVVHYETNCLSVFTVNTLVITDGKNE